MKEEGGVTLSFPREAESRIYGSVENAWQLMDEYQENITILRADHSNVINRQTWQKIQTIMPKVKFVNVKDANHMLPLEHPEKLSQLILNNSK